MQWVGIFGVSKEIRSDGGSQFTSKLSEDLSVLLGYKHLVVVPYTNGLAERRMTEVMKHPRALKSGLRKIGVTIFHWRSVLSIIRWMDPLKLKRRE